MISDIGCNRYDVNFIVVDFQTEFEITRINGIHNTYIQGDVLLVADEFNDGWMRGLRLGDLEVSHKHKPP